MRMCQIGKSQFSTGVVTTLSKEDLRELCATVQSRENSTYFHITTCDNYGPFAGRHYIIKGNIGQVHDSIEIIFNQEETD